MSKSKIRGALLCAFVAVLAVLSIAFGAARPAKERAAALAVEVTDGGELGTVYIDGQAISATQTVTVEAGRGITLKAAADKDVPDQKEYYVFDGWYSAADKVLVSRESEYYFVPAADTSLAPKFVAAVPIASAAELSSIMTVYTDTYAITNFKLTADVTLTAAFTPIGGAPAADASKSSAYRSVFDGAGHTVTNFSLANPEDDFYGGRGFIGHLYGGAIRNLKLFASINLTSKSRYSGAIAGKAENFLIENCRVDGTVSDQQVFGGIVGSAEGRAVIKDCYNGANIASGKAGGILADINSVSGNNLSIVNCVNTGNITGGSMAGGIAASVSSTAVIENCINSGSITLKSNYYAGGILGYGGNNMVKISSCLNTGDVILTGGAIQAGGIVGSFGSEGDKFVFDCVNIGAVYGGQMTGGIIGKASLVQAEDCYSDVAAAGGLIGSGTFKSTASVKTALLADMLCRADMSLPLIYEDLSGFTVTAPEPGVYYLPIPSGLTAYKNEAKVEGDVVTVTLSEKPMGGGTPNETNIEAVTARSLPRFTAIFPNGTISDGWFADGALTSAYTYPDLSGAVTLYTRGASLLGGGDGSADSPYKLGAEDNIKCLSGYVNGETDGVFLKIAGKEFISAAGMFGGKSYELTADITLNGNHTPIGSNDGTPFNGRFDGKGHTVTFALDDSSRAVAAPGLFGYLGESEITNIKVNGNVKASGDVKGVGILAGVLCGNAVLRDIELFGSVNTIITGYSFYSNTGALCGSVVNGGSIAAENVINNAAVTTSMQYATTGGLVGCVDTKLYCSFTDCVNSGAVTVSSNHCGGIVGKVLSCHATQNIDLVGCVNRGKISGTDAYTLTGILGTSDEAELTVRIKNCENYGEISGKTRYGAAGIAAYLKDKETLVEGCMNFGRIETVKTNSNSTNAAAGIVSVGLDAPLCKLIDCGNFGAIVSDTYAAGLGCMNDGAKYSLYNCFNVGPIKGAKKAAQLSYPAAVTSKGSIEKGSVVSASDEVPQNAKIGAFGVVIGEFNRQIASSTGVYLKADNAASGASTVLNFGTAADVSVCSAVKAVSGTDNVYGNPGAPRSYTGTSVTIDNAGEEARYFVEISEAGKAPSYAVLDVKAESVLCDVTIGGISYSDGGKYTHKYWPTDEKLDAAVSAPAGAAVSVTYNGAAVDVSEGGLVKFAAGAGGLLKISVTAAGYSANIINIEIVRDYTLPGDIGTSENPIIIGNADELREKIVNANADRKVYFALSGDIDLGGDNWQPIDNGTYNGLFISLDGGGYSLKNMTYNSKVEFSDNYGLFDTLADGSEIRNLTFQDVNIKNLSCFYFGLITPAAHNCVISDVNVIGGIVNLTGVSNFDSGLLVANAYSGITMSDITVENVSVNSKYGFAGLVYSSLSSSVKADNVTMRGVAITAQNTGSLMVGTVNSAVINKATADNCTLTVTNTSDDVAAAGLAARIGGSITVTDAAVTNTVVTAKGDNVSEYAGGLVGYVAGETFITNALFSGAVANFYNDSYAGGLVARGSQNVSVTGSLNAGYVASGGKRSFAGGLIGYADRSATVSGSVNLGAVQARRGSAGGLVGYIANNAYILDSYNAQLVVGATSDSLVVGAKGAATLSNAFYYGLLGSSGLGGDAKPFEEAKEDEGGILQPSAVDVLLTVTGKDYRFIKTDGYPFPVPNGVRLDFSKFSAPPVVTTDSGAKTQNAYFTADAYVEVLNAETGCDNTISVKVPGASFTLSRLYTDGVISEATAAGDTVGFTVDTGAVNKTYLLRLSQNGKNDVFVSVYVGRSTQYTIASKEDFAKIYDDLDGKYVLSQDVVLGTIQPVGSAGTPFTGILDGGGHKLTSVIINGANGLGLFGYTNGALIENLTLEAAVTGKGVIGGFIGEAANGTILNNCVFKGTLNANGADIGGLVGRTNSKGLMAASCTVDSGTVIVNKGSGNTGGLAGNGGIFEGCTVKAEISANLLGGGLVGGYQNSAEFTDCYFAGTLTYTGNHTNNYPYIGIVNGYGAWVKFGLVRTGQLIDIKYTSSVAVTKVELFNADMSTAADIDGFNGGESDEFTVKAKFGVTHAELGLLSETERNGVTGNYGGPVLGFTMADGTLRYIGTLDRTKYAFVSSFDLDLDQLTVYNDDLSGLKIDTTAGTAPYKTENYQQRDVSIFGTVTVETAGQFAHLSWCVNGGIPVTFNDGGKTYYYNERSIATLSVRLGADIDLTSDRQFYGFGNSEMNPYRGSLFGSGKTITVDMELSEGYLVGIIGCSSEQNYDVTVDNLTVRGQISGRQHVGLIGGFDAYMRSGRLEMRNVINYADIFAGRQAGMVGYLNSGGQGLAGANGVTFKNCVNYGNITAEHGLAGAFLGDAYTHSGGVLAIDGGLNYGSVVVTSGSYAGGFAGRVKSLTLSGNVTNYGGVSARRGGFAGGIAGAVGSANDKDVCVLRALGGYVRNYGLVAAKDAAGGLFAQIGFSAAPIAEISGFNSTTIKSLGDVYSANGKGALTAAADYIEGATLESAFETAVLSGRVFSGIAE